MSLESMTSKDEVRLPDVNTLKMDQPVQWLFRGVDDVRKNLIPSLMYGGIFVFLGYVLGWIFNFEFIYILAMTAGFMLVGPFLATGLYDMAKRSEEGQPVDFFQALTAWRGNVWGIMLFGLMVGLMLTFWVRTAAVLFAVFVKNTNSPSSLNVATDIGHLFFTGAGLSFLVVFMITGGMVALIVYAAGLFSIPMMVDSKENDFLLSIITSFKAVLTNKGPLLLWAALLVILMGVGFATFYIGLAITLPIAAYGTWHAYRDTVMMATYRR